MPKLENRCFYRQNDGVYCKNGYLVKDTVTPLENEQADLVTTEPIQIEDTMIKCPVCDEGVIISPEGREILEFMKKHLRPVVQDLIQELTQ